MFKYIALILAGLVVDQLSKSLAVWFLTDITTLPLIPNVFHLTYTKNSGIAFSFLSGKQTLIIIVTSLCILALFYLLYSMPKNRRYHLVNIGLSLIISGALGNLIDRITNGFVVDFLDFRLIGFPIFNFADVFVCCGAGLIIYAIIHNRQLLQDPPEKPKKPKQPKKTAKKRPTQAAKPSPELTKEEKNQISKIKRRSASASSSSSIEPQVKTSVMILKPHLKKKPVPKASRYETKNLQELRQLQRDYEKAYQIPSRGQKQSAKAKKNIK